MKIEVFYIDSTLPEGKQIRTVATCKDLNDACLVAVGVASRLDINVPVHVWLRGTRKDPHNTCLGYVFTNNVNARSLEVLTQQCREALRKHCVAAKQRAAEDKARQQEAQKRTLWVYQRWGIDARLVIFHDEAFLAALRKDDFAAAEQRAVELGHLPQQKEVA